MDMHAISCQYYAKDLSFVEHVLFHFEHLMVVRTNKLIRSQLLKERLVTCAALIILIGLNNFIAMILKGLLSNQAIYEIN